MRIVHIADVHWRGLSRHEEYTKSFSEFFKKCKELSPDVIYIGGDIVHSKTQGISPELIDRLSWWFTSLSEICPVHVILGNHDGLILNKDRQDAISPIISALDNDNIHLYKKSGVYPIEDTGFNWCVFSCFDEEGWQKVEPVEGDINIALFHGAVWGSKTDIDWEIEGDVTVDLFETFDFALLGDIHKRQFLNTKKTIAYCGSSIQQNYGEDAGKGFLLWDIKSKDDFTCEFHEIPHYSPFVTIDWAGTVDDTLAIAKNHNPGARFRIRSKSKITQADSQEIAYRLKRDMSASETVFKSENQFSIEKLTAVEKASNFNLRDIATHYSLFSDYLKNVEVDEETREDIKVLVDKYFSLSTSKDEIVRNTRWQIESIDFDNLFAYGKDNRIDFSKNTGITGIFGKNTKGKSSIIGALMYSLFNTTDRGPVKNLHIINNRKNFAKGSVDITINDERLRITRETVKHTTRKGETYASTSLSLSKVLSDGTLGENLTEEQRRETEKVLRRLIGTSDDFLMTSLASQGGMNNFIGEGSASRKSILTKFLDLEVFDRMLDHCKQDYSEIKAISRSIKKADWEDLISKEKINLKDLKADLKKSKADISSLRELLSTLKEERSNLGLSSKECFTDRQIQDKQREIEKKTEAAENTRLKIQELESSITEKEKKREKIEEVCNSISIDDLHSQKNEKIDLEKKIIKSSNNRDKLKQSITRLESSAEMLNKVPCGDKFPTCMFIESSHKDKDRIEEEIESLRIAIEAIDSLKKSLKIIEKIGPEEKIKKYDALVLKSKELTGDIVVTKGQLANLRESHSRNLQIISESSRTLEKMKIFAETHKDTDVQRIQDKISEITALIESGERSHHKIIEKITESKLKVKNLENDRDNHSEIKRQMRVYDLFTQAVSKKGIPAQIMMSRLPVINSEIASVLHGVVDFTVSLESDPSTNSLEVYIDYGDSKRVIELASGMEKMISSLAIRVALINTSSLTKTNVMIIDEGFGSLDETNLEACTRLLESLKKWFRNIIVISHVDAVKDCVDNSVEIVKKGKNSHVRFT
jgi:DNA repair exonuclease SbcCD ATPase subunit